MKIKNYKSIFLLVILLIGISKANAQKPNLTLTIEVLGFDTTYNCSKDIEYCIQINIHNNSDTAINFGHMSCSWYEDFEIEKGAFYFCDKGCDKNIPTNTIINPNETCSNRIFIYKTKKETNEIQLSLLYLNGFDYIRTWPTEIQNTEQESLKTKTFRFKSNTCKLETKKHIPFFYKKPYK